MVKNLKIYNTLTNRIKKIKGIILLGTLGGSLSMTACSNQKIYSLPSNIVYDYEDDNKNINDSNNNNYEDYNDNYSNNYDNYDELDDKYSDAEKEYSTGQTSAPLIDDNQSVESNSDDTLVQVIINSNIKLENSDLNNLNTIIESINVDYKHSEYFEIENAISKYENSKLNPIVNSSRIIEDKITFDTLYKIVKTNNSEYKEKNSVITKYQIPTDSDLKKICEWICESINYEIQFGNIDVNLLETKIEKLKIFEVSSFSYAYYDVDEGLIAFNKSMIEQSERENIFMETICHEAKHLVQDVSKIDLDGNINKSFGVCKMWNDLTVNSLYPNWLYEVVAEKQTLKQLNIDKSLNYENYIKSFDTITMSMIAKHEVGMLEEICMQSDLDKLYEYFGAFTDEQKSEISTMLYACNIILTEDGVSSSNDFYNNYRNATGTKMTMTDKRYYKYSLSSSVSQTLSKIFYKNISENLENKEISINEIFYLISNFENQLSMSYHYYDQNRTDEYQDFYQNYNAIQSELFTVIAKKLNLSKEDVMTAYYKYYEEYSNPENINLISDENKKFIGQQGSKNNYNNGPVHKYVVKYSKSYSK